MIRETWILRIDGSYMILFNDLYLDEENKVFCITSVLIDGFYHYYLSSGKYAPASEITLAERDDLVNKFCSCSLPYSLPITNTVISQVR